MTPSPETPYHPRERILGRIDGERPGHTFVIFGALHGNEPGGVIAAQRVLHALEGLRPRLRGSVLGVVGNLAALEADLRYLDRDLNRDWLPERIAALRAQDPAEDRGEDGEARALLALLDGLHAEADGPLIFLDLHSTSGDSPPFCAMADTLHNRPIAFALPIPIILGLEESLDGTLLGYLSEAGHIGVVVEGGQHRDPQTPDYLEAAIWLSLVAAGSLEREDNPELDAHRARLEAIAEGHPRVVEIRHRHALSPGDGFKMRPGFKGMEPVHEGEILGHDRQGEIKAPMAGRMLMPLYQGQGDEGFFLVGEVSQAWLSLSALLRKLHLEGILSLLPGVTREREHPDRLHVATEIPRRHAVNVFHLFGYRRRRDDGEGKLVFTRRRPHPHEG